MAADRWRHLAPTVGKFGAVGASAYLVDVIVFNALLAASLQVAPDGKPLAAKAVSTVAAMTVGYLGNRMWAFRTTNGTAHRHRTGKQIAMFTAVNIAAAVIALACLATSRYLLGFTSIIADNIAGNIIGTGLGTMFRFAAYHTWVFPPTAPPPDHPLRPDRNGAP